MTPDPAAAAAGYAAPLSSLSQLPKIDRHIDRSLSSKGNASWDSGALSHWAFSGYRFVVSIPYNAILASNC